VNKSQGSKVTAANGAQAFGGQTMVGRLERVMVCSPRAAGWFEDAVWPAWQELGYQHSPDPFLAQEQHEAMCAALEEAGVEVLHLQPEDSVELRKSNNTATDKGVCATLTLDGVYVHDASLVCDAGAILLRMGKPEREAEPAAHRACYESQGIPILGEIQDPGAVEGGDCVWLDERTLLVGRGHRTNAAGIEQLRALLAPRGVEVFAAPLPYSAGPCACLHLMSLVSLLDEKLLIADRAWLAVETVELLEARDFTFVFLEPSEQATLACNVLALGERRLLALEENSVTNQLLADAGFEVFTFLGSELGINGGGGPTCLTRPIKRSGARG
jgi:N-dimethylarginine dimethylaminohydrolase